MSKYFRPWNIDQTLLLPPNVQDFVPKGHVSRFIVELVREPRICAGPHCLSSLLGNMTTLERWNSFGSFASAIPM